MAVSFERFEEITAELTDRLPEELFRELSGGVMAREQTKLHPAGLNGDLYILGEYHVHPHLGRFVVLYYGSLWPVWAGWRRRACGSGCGRCCGMSSSITWNPWRERRIWRWRTRRKLRFIAGNGRKLLDGLRCRY